MSKLFGKIAGFFGRKGFVGTDKSGNRYFSLTEELDGVKKEKRWVLFKGEDDPTLIPVEWICWLNGQRKKAPTAEEMADLEARRQRLRQNVALLKREEEERKAREGSYPKVVNTGKVGGPDLKSFMRQFPTCSEGEKHEEVLDSNKSSRAEGAGARIEKGKAKPVQESSEPTGSGPTFKPGTWQPPT